MTQALIELCNVSKNFAGVKALNDVSIAVSPGRVVCLLGDNGAGKSTLIKILSGFHPPSSGAIYMNGEETVFADPRDARARDDVTVPAAIRQWADLGSGTGNGVIRRPRPIRRHERYGSSGCVYQIETVEPFDLPRRGNQGGSADGIGEPCGGIVHRREEFGGGNRHRKRARVEAAPNLGLGLKIEEGAVHRRKQQQQRDRGGEDDRPYPHDGSASMSSRPTMNGGHSRAMVNRCARARQSDCIPSVPAR